MQKSLSALFGSSWSEKSRKAGKNAPSVTGCHRAVSLCTGVDNHLFVKVNPMLYLLLYFSELIQRMNEGYCKSASLQYQAILLKKLGVLPTHCCVEFKFNINFSSSTTLLFVFRGT